MLKKIFLTILSTWICLLWSNNARADLYIGADFTYSVFDYEHDQKYLTENYSAAGPILGLNVGPVGLEGYYKISVDGTNDFGLDSELKAYGLDFILALPMSDLVDFVASIGYAKYELSYDAPSGESIELKSDGPRFGLGLQLHLTQKLYLRTMYHYTSINSGIEEFKSINEFSAGLRYYF